MAVKVRRRISESSSTPSLTVGQFCNYIAPSVWKKDEFLEWPPDVFALAAALLLKSGAYCCAVSPRWKRKRPDGWPKRMARVGEKWRAAVSKPPPSVRKWHRILVANQSVQVSEVEQTDILWDALLHLCAAADEACKGVGFELHTTQPEYFSGQAAMQLAFSEWRFELSTLCKQVPHSTVRVLPKLHTPQSGMTIRSLTHHLALCPAGDVKARWVPQMMSERRTRHCLNLLLVPWPLGTNPADFRSVAAREAVLPDMPPNYGFFEYEPPAVKLRTQNSQNDPLKALRGLLEEAQKVVDKIDGVIFPELAVTVDQSTRIRSYLMKKGIFLVCGVRGQSSSRRPGGKNFLSFDFPFLPGYFMHFEQSKHHRWRLDKRQIVQYGLGSALNISGRKGEARYWWENIGIENRQVYFVVLESWLTLCALICEDLARQDPVAEVVRAVGPNLVIAILMDGPQLPSRWPARYATVLADDPGSSVLTLTSLGMCELSRPALIQKPSRAIALWKDAKSGEAISIELPEKKEAVVLSISEDSENEWTADGRPDDYSTSYPTLSGTHFISSSTTDKKKPKR